VTLTLPPEDVEVAVVAYEGDRASEPATRRLRWTGSKDGKEPLPRLRALFVGVNKYTNFNRLSFAAKDAGDLKKLFEAHKGKSYSHVEAQLLTDVKHDEVIKGLEWLEKGDETDSNLVSLIFLAGHGFTDTKQRFYFMAINSDPADLRNTAVSADQIVSTLRSLKGIRIVMLDACRAGAGTDRAALAALGAVDMNRAPNEIGDQSLQMLLYASAQARQVSLEHPGWGNGAFTKAMIEGLSGAADGRKLGYVEADELGTYVRRRVMELAKEKGVLQEPKPLLTVPGMKLVRL
jgi:hypothetical protein